MNASRAGISGEFGALYRPTGRDSIPPKRLLRALLLQAFYSIHLERRLIKRIDFDILFCWFIGLRVDDPVWDATTFNKNREQLLAGEVAAGFLPAMLAQPYVRGLLSSEHSSVDGTLLEAWASAKGLRPKDASGPPPPAGRNGVQDFPSKTCGNERHTSTTDPEAKLFRKGPGKEVKLFVLGHALMKSRNGLIVGAVATHASDHAASLVALHMIAPHADRPNSITFGADKRFDVCDLVTELDEVNITPHLAQNASGRHPANDGRTTRHPGYAVSQRIRKRIEKAVNWIKTVAGLRKVLHCGPPKVSWRLAVVMAAYNLVGRPKLLGVKA